MDHLSWPDAFAIACVCGACVVAWWLFLRSMRDVAPARRRSAMEMLHEERMEELRKPRPTHTFRIPVSDAYVKELVDKGLLVKNDDGSFGMLVLGRVADVQKAAPKAKASAGGGDAVS